MGKHLRNDTEVTGSGLEQLSMSESIVDSVVADLWEITGACSATDDGMDAIGQVGGYLNALVNPGPETGDPELIVFGIRRWLSEMAAEPAPAPVATVTPLRPASSDLDASVSRHPAGGKIKRNIRALLGDPPKRD